MTRMRMMLLLLLTCVRASSSSSVVLLIDSYCRLLHILSVRLSVRAVPARKEKKREKKRRPTGNVISDSNLLYCASRARTHARNARGDAAAAAVPSVCVLDVTGIGFLVSIFEGCQGKEMKTDLDRAVQSRCGREHKKRIPPLFLSLSSRRCLPLDHDGSS